MTFSMNITITIAMVVNSTFGIVLGNFIYQYIIGKRDWAIAADRSFFQVSAIATIMLIGILADM